MKILIYSITFQLFLAKIQTFAPLDISGPTLSFKIQMYSKMISPKNVHLSKNTFSILFGKMQYNAAFQLGFPVNKKLSRKNTKIVFAKFRGKTNSAKTISILVATINCEIKLMEFSAYRVEQEKFYYIIINNFSSVFFRNILAFPPPPKFLS